MRAFPDPGKESILDIPLPRSSSMNIPRSDKVRFRKIDHGKTRWVGFKDPGLWVLIGIDGTTPLVSEYEGLAPYAGELWEHLCVHRSFGDLGVKGMVERFPVLRQPLRQLVLDSKYSMGLVDWLKAFPEDRDLVRGLVRSSKAALEWALVFPQDRHLMRHLVTESRWARLWAKEFPEDRDVMRPFVTRSEDALEWARSWHLDKDLMRPFVTGSAEARAWITFVGPEDRHLMLPYVTDPFDKALLSNWKLL